MAAVLRMQGSKSAGSNVKVTFKEDTLKDQRTNASNDGFNGIRANATAEALRMRLLSFPSILVEDDDDDVNSVETECSVTGQVKEDETPNAGIESSIATVSSEFVTHKSDHISDDGSAGSICNHQRGSSCSSFDKAVDAIDLFRVTEICMKSDDKHLDKASDFDGSFSCSSPDSEGKIAAIFSAFRIRTSRAEAEHGKEDCRSNLGSVIEASENSRKMERSSISQPLVDDDDETMSNRSFDSMRPTMSDAFEWFEEKERACCITASESSEIVSLQDFHIINDGSVSQSSITHNSDILTDDKTTSCRSSADILNESGAENIEYHCITHDGAILKVSAPNDEILGSSSFDSTIHSETMSTTVDGLNAASDKACNDHSLNSESENGVDTTIEYHVTSKDGSFVKFSFPEDPRSEKLDYRSIESALPVIVAPRRSDIFVGKARNCLMKDATIDNEFGEKCCDGTEQLVNETATTSTVSTLDSSGHSCMDVLNYPTEVEVTFDSQKYAV